MKIPVTWLSAAFMAVTALASTAVKAADFPSKPVTVVMGYAAGGPTDVYMRAIAPRLSREWKQPVVVENRPGASEGIAAQYVARAPADGHTLLISTEGPLTINPFLFSKLPYDPAKDFAPVSLLLSSPLALAINPSLGVNTLAEFIALAKTRAAAGKPLSYGSAGPGTVIHFPMAMLAHRNGVQMTHVPYKGLAPVFTDLAAGHIDAAWMAVSGATPFVKEGKFKALVVGAPARANSLPDVPVFKETGIAPIQADFVFTLVAPAGTPRDITEKIAADIRKIIMDPAFRAEFADPFGYVMYGSTPAELAQYLEKDRAAQAERVRISGVKLD